MLDMQMILRATCHAGKPVLCEGLDLNERVLLQQLHQVCQIIRIAEVLAARSDLRKQLVGSGKEFSRGKAKHFDTVFRAWRDTSKYGGGIKHPDGVPYVTNPAAELLSPAEARAAQQDAFLAHIELQNGREILTRWPVLKDVMDT